jgi:hypothetical protein
MVEVRELHVRYDETPEARRLGERLHVTLPTDGERPLPSLSLPLSRPGAAREALLTLGDVFVSDLRRKASDRSDYLAYLAKSGKKATAAVWEAQKAFLAAQYGEAKKETSPLDPILTVSSEGLAFEVYSKDESAYARLVLAPTEVEGAWSGTEPRTTTLAWSSAAKGAVSAIRGFRPTTLELVPSSTEQRGARAVPYRWLRAFGQTMLAATAPSTTFALAPIDLYNVLLSLRRKKAKKPPRSLRYELVPGERPRIVLEPWDQVIDSAAEPYAGTKATVVRTFGRDRLQLLARLLPFTQAVRVHLGGSGMPTFYVLDLGGGSSFTLALSGWTDSGWAGISLLDDPTGAADTELLGRQLLTELAAGPRALAELVHHGRTEASVRAALAALLLGGRVVLDLARGRYAVRELLATPAEPDKLRFRDATDEKAHRLLAGVTLEKLHTLGADGVRIEGVVVDELAHRKMRTTLTIDREGRTSDASCTCARFVRAGLREGPCEHLIALRLCHAREEARLAAARDTPEGKRLIRAETKSFIRRKGGRADYAQLSLDDRSVIARSGPSLQALRVARLLFASADAARAEYFERLATLEKHGFMDAQLDPQEVRL